ncbi:hypothetical protein MTBUT4_180042 [Magnetospirillum sp. UT-4]|nr:hypothetical protein MTBUT4_180042 [Magnetospirillum sp. UT-4]
MRDMMPVNTTGLTGILPPLRRRPCRPAGANDALHGGPSLRGWASPTRARTRPPGEGAK